LFFAGIFLSAFSQSFEEMATEQAVDEKKQETTKGAEKLETEELNAGAENEKRNGDSIYTTPLPNRLVVTMAPGKFRRLSFFINRARKILRCDETLTITGVDKAISMTCTLVELLKRQKIAKVTKIATNMNLNPNFGRYGGNVAWGQPVPTIVFHLTRGDHATYVSDYHQRKVIEIFENKDSDHSGKLNKKAVEELDLPRVFLSTPQQKEQGKKSLEGIDGNDVNLPHFIRYCSLLIHPLLKDPVFKANLVALGIGPHEEAQAEFHQ